MFRRLLRLIRMMLPAVIVSVAWAGWWLFGDGPIKVSRPDREIAGADLWQVGPTTVVEAPTGGIPPDQRRYVYWRELDTGKCIIEPILQTTSNVWLARDEKTLIVALDNGPIQLFDRTTGRLRKELPALGLWKQRRQVFFTPDHKSMTYEALDGSIIVADVATGSVAYRFPDLRAPVGISPDGQIVVAAKDQTTLVVRDLSTDADVTETSCADVDDIMEPVVGPGGRRILLMTRNAGQYIHRINDREAQRRMRACHFLDARRLRKTDADDRARPALRKSQSRLLALRRVLDLELEVRLAAAFLPALGAVECGLVERLVELAAELVDDGGLRLRERAGEQGRDYSDGSQKLALNCTPKVRGSLMKPVRLLKSMPPTIRIWLVMLRPNSAASYLPLPQT